ncbi:MAG: dTDP-4-dehydrorhamnose 3,5-epimerase [Caldimonas sp.]
MEVTTTALAGVLIVQPKVFADARGFFLESFNQREFDAAVGASVNFVQDNHSRSAQGVLRGLHLQVEPHAQGKLVRVTKGRIFDVAVDVRADSPTYRQWVGLELDDVEHRQIWIPPGLAHGFLVMSESADVQYKTTDYYTPAAEVGIRWDDPALAIAWPDIGTPYALSAKDRSAPGLDAMRPGR